jgi:hypothetical protein
VPEAAVQTEGDQTYVYEIVQEGAKTIARQTQVDVGANESGFVEIRNGLAPGAQVVADGLSRVEPNAPIRIAGAHQRQGRAQLSSAQPSSAEPSSTHQTSPRPDGLRPTSP